MASDGKVVFEITADYTSLKKALEDATKAIQAESKKWDQALKDVTSSVNTESKKWDSDVKTASESITKSINQAFDIERVKNFVIEVSKELGQLAMESLGLASELVETQNRIDKAFGPEGSKKVEQWAANVTRQFGLTEFQAKKYAASLGALFVNAGHDQEEALDMAINLVERSADLASFYDTPFDESFQKILSAISGRTQAIKEFGVDVQLAAMTEYAALTGYGDYKELALADKQLLMHNKILNDTAIAQGDFADTAETYANSLRRIENVTTWMKTEMGKLLMPAAQTITDTIADMMETLAYGPKDTFLDAASDSISETEQKATQAQGLLAYLESLYEKYGEEATATKQWKSAVEELNQVLPGTKDILEKQGTTIEENIGKLRTMREEMRKTAIYSAMSKTLEEEYAALGQQNVALEKAYVQRDKASVMRDSQQADLLTMLEAYANELEAQTNAGRSRGIDMSLYSERLGEYRDNFSTYDVPELTAVLSQLVTDLDAAYRTTGTRKEDQLWNQDLSDALLAPEQVQAISETLEAYQSQVDDAERQIASINEDIAQTEKDIAVTENAIERMAQSLTQSANDTAAAGSGAAASISQAGGNVADAMNSAAAVIRGSGTGLNFSKSYQVHGSHASGLDYVPFDGYIAELHKGEAILPAFEASIFRNDLHSEPFSQMDYEILANAIWSKAPSLGGGDVFLDGKSVGRVISDYQADSLRTMTRSGFRAP